MDFNVNRSYRAGYREIWTLGEVETGTDPINMYPSGCKKWGVQIPIEVGRFTVTLRQAGIEFCTRKRE